MIGQVLIYVILEFLLKKKKKKKTHGRMVGHGDAVFGWVTHFGFIISIQYIFIIRDPEPITHDIHVQL